MLVFPRWPCGVDVERLVSGSGALMELILAFLRIFPSDDSGPSVRGMANGAARLSGRVLGLRYANPSYDSVLALYPRGFNIRRNKIAYMVSSRFARLGVL